MGMSRSLRRVWRAWPRIKQKLGEEKYKYIAQPSTIYIWSGPASNWVTAVYVVDASKSSP